MDPDRLLNLQTELLRLQHSLLRVTAEVESVAIELCSLNSALPQPSLSLALIQYERGFLARCVHQQVLDAGALLLPVDAQGFIVENEEAVYGEGADPSLSPILWFTGTSNTPSVDPIIADPVNSSSPPLSSLSRVSSPPRRRVAALILPTSAVDTCSCRHHSYRVSEDHRAARTFACNWSKDRAASKRNSLRPPDTK
jgi:hypothetical protein